MPGGPGASSLQFFPGSGYRIVKNAVTDSVAVLKRMNPFTFYGDFPVALFQTPVQADWDTPARERISFWVSAGVPVVLTM
jgi:hypothetical protein